MAATTINKTPNSDINSLIEQNIDYINLALFVGLYIACFVYLLQDSVKPIHPKFSNVIGIFIAQLIYLMLICICLPKLDEKNNNWTLSWGALLISAILEFVSSFMVLLKYKNLQESDDTEQDLLGNAKLKLLDKNGKPLDKTLDSNDYNIALILCDVFGIVLLGLLMSDGEAAGEISAMKTAFYFILGGGLLATSSTMVHFAKMFYDQEQTSTSTHNTKVHKNNKVIPALIFLCIFHILFVVFISFIISKKSSDTLNWIVTLSWGSVFMSSVFQIISIFIVIVCYKYINDKYLSKNADLEFSTALMRELQDYNNLFVTVTTITIVFVAVLLSGHSYLNNPTHNFIFRPYYYCILIYVMGISILSMSSEMIKISNDFIYFKNSAAISLH